jgi:glycosyltransferase involved in cell wall biosynthesis
VQYIKKKADEAGMGDRVFVHGRVDDHRIVESMLFECGIAIAPYFPDDKNSFSYYADPGKIKVYLGCGLPIVITDVPPIAKELYRTKAGLISEYDVSDMADKIQEIWNEKNYLIFREHSKKLGMQFSWKNIFDAVFGAINKK